MDTPVEIAIAVVQHEDCFLVGLRPDGVPLAGYSEFPGGKLLHGETAADAVRRECQEETGIDVTVGKPYPEVVHRYDHGAVRLHFFACRPIDPAQEPKGSFRWVNRAQLSELRFPEANAALIEHLTRQRS